MKMDINALMWMASILSLIGLVLNIQKSSLCWALWLISTGAWVVISAVRQDWPMFAMQLGIQFGNVAGLVTWKREASRKAVLA